MKTFPILTGMLLGAVIGLAFVGFTFAGVSKGSAFRTDCTSGQMVNVRMESAECTADGSAPVDCVDRARLEFCK